MTGLTEVERKMRRDALREAQLQTSEFPRTRDGYYAASRNLLQRMCQHFGLTIPKGADPKARGPWLHALARAGKIPKVIIERARDGDSVTLSHDGRLAARALTPKDIAVIEAEIARVAAPGAEQPFVD